MKKLQSSFASLFMAAALASVLSCAEQDGTSMLSAIGALQPSGPLNGNINSTAPVGGEIFNSAVGDPLTLATAKEWTANYREKNPGSTEGHFFGTEIIKQILSEKGCVGIRIFYALDEHGEKKLLVVGVDAMGNNLLPNEDGTSGNTIADFSFPCPNMCQGDGQEAL